MIREARDFWFEICAQRFAADPDRIDRMAEILENTASKTDLTDAIRKMETIIAKERQRAHGKSAAAAELMQLSEVLQDLHFASKSRDVLLFRRKIQLMMAVLRQPDETKEKWFALSKRAKESGRLTSWIEELVDQAIAGKLAQRIDEESTMPGEAFTKYLESLALRDVQAVADEPDIWLGELSTADAEWIQASQAPAELYDEWSNAPEEERPLLMARWVSEGRVRRINFGPGRGLSSETPGFCYMRRGRELLSTGKKQQGFALIRAGLELDPVVASEAFALWLANPLNKESENLLDDDEVVGFVREIYGPDMPTKIKDMRR